MLNNLCFARIQPDNCVWRDGQTDVRVHFFLKSETISQLIDRLCYSINVPSQTLTIWRCGGVHQLDETLTFEQQAIQDNQKLIIKYDKPNLALENTHQMPPRQKTVDVFIQNDQTQNPNYVIDLPIQSQLTKSQILWFLFKQNIITQVYKYQKLINKCDNDSNITIMHKDLIEFVHLELTFSEIPTNKSYVMIQIFKNNRQQNSILQEDSLKTMRETINSLPNALKLPQDMTWQLTDSQNRFISSVLDTPYNQLSNNILLYLHGNEPNVVENNIIQSDMVTLKLTSLNFKWADTTQTECDQLSNNQTLVSLDKWLKEVYKENVSNMQLEYRYTAHVENSRIPLNTNLFQLKSYHLWVRQIQI